MRALVRNNKEMSHLPFTPNHSRTWYALEESQGTAVLRGPRCPLPSPQGPDLRVSLATLVASPSTSSVFQERCMAGATVWPLRAAVYAECPALLWSGLLCCGHRGCLASMPEGLRRCFQLWAIRGQSCSTTGAGAAMVLLSSLFLGAVPQGMWDFSSPTRD